MNKQNTQGQPGFFEYLKSKLFLKQLLFIFGLLFLIIFLAQLLLKVYTNHGQKLELPKYIGKNIDEAKEAADDASFEIVVNDSIFIVGKDGGIITDQNPKPGSLVKENRKIYVTITKYGTETVKVGDLPVLYGNAFDQKKTELKYRDIECVIKDYAYDPGEPNHILEVWYKNELIISKDVRKEDVQIAKGDQLEFIVSRKDGGEVTIPNLKCLDIEEARFLLETSKLQLGQITEKSESDPEATWYIISQSPPYDGISNIKMGEKIDINVSTQKPLDCN
ncbi:MAG TPA: PASTA domain-containing protein [Saprospiraceae bacterium]|nr:PASTA domain-containing protein [Saprospiraceae bacterium]